MAEPVRLRILVVDDEPGMRSAIVRALEDFSPRLPDVELDLLFEVAEVGTGEEALERIRQSPPDILMLDYKLPGISGLEVLERIAGGDFITVVISAYASLDMAIQATKQGAHDLLPKPFTPAELKATLIKSSRHLLLQREAHRLAQEKKEIRFRFIQTLAHELKAPLAAVQSYLALLRSHVDRDDPALHEQIVSRSLLRVEGMRKLISDLLDLTRIESGEKPRQPQELDLAEVARAIADGFQALASERRVTIEVVTSERIPVVADFSEIEIILNNLVSNAIKYNRDGGRVEVRIGSDAEQIRIEVSDTGIGISAEDQAQLFREFGRIRTRQTEKIVGSGLGLSIVKKIAALNSGEVAVTSEPDIGSIFTVTLRRPDNGS